MTAEVVVPVDAVAQTELDGVKEVTLDGNGDGAISIRILDRIGNIVVGETVVEPGTSLKLDALQSNTEYVVEVKTTADFVLLNFH